MTSPQTLPRIQLDPSQPFTRADARSAGLPLSDLLSRKFKRLFYDLYLDASIPESPQIRALAALKVSPAGSHISHHTAAELWGGVAPDDPAIHVSVPTAAARTRRQGITAHLRLEGLRTMEQDGITLSAPSACFLELAAIGVGLVDLVILGDSLVRKNLVSVERLVEAAAAYSGRGALVARRAAGLVRAGVDSPMETRLRLLVVLAGLPEPEVNVVLRDSDGEWLMRFDLKFRRVRLILEYDGRQHAEDARQWGRDLARREALDRAGYRILVIRAEDIYGTPEETLARIRTALHELGGQVPRRLNPQWRRHFPGRTQP